MPLYLSSAFILLSARLGYGTYLEYVFSLSLYLEKINSLLKEFTKPTHLFNFHEPTVALQKLFSSCRKYCLFTHENIFLPPRIFYRSFQGSILENYFLKKYQV